MGAKVIECVDDAFVPDEGDAMAFEFVGASFTFFEVGRWGDGLEHDGGRSAVQKVGKWNR